MALFYRGHKIYNQHVVDTNLLMSMEIDDDLQSQQHFDDAKSFKSLRSMRSIRSEVHIVSSREADDGDQRDGGRSNMGAMFRRSEGVINIQSGSNLHNNANSQNRFKNTGEGQQM